MMSLRKYLDKIKPNFEAGEKLHAFQSVFEGFETFLLHRQERIFMTPLIQSES